MNKKKIIIIALSLVLFLVAGAFVSLFGKQDFEKVKDKININQEETVEIRNLLYNSDFSINTSGKELFSSEDGVKYGTKFFDGWSDNCGTCTDYLLYSTNSGLYAKIGADTSSLDLVQYIDFGKDYVGKDYTLTISVNGVVYSKSFNFINGTEYILNTGSFVVVFSMTTDSGYLKCVIQFKPSFDGEINWVQLEKGLIFTGHSEGPSEPFVKPE